MGGEVAGIVREVWQGREVVGIVREVWQGEEGRSRVVERYMGEGEIEGTDGEREVGRGEGKFGDQLEK